jgi:hypothetical protein
MIFPEFYCSYIQNIIIYFLVAMATGVVTCISITPICILAGVLQM